MDKVKMPKLPKKDMPVYSDDDIAHILAVCDSPRDRAIVLFLIDSGVRSAELVALDVGDVDLRDGAVKVRQGKGQKDRTAYISSRTAKQLARYLAGRGAVGPDDPLFLSKRGGKRLTRSGLGQLMKRLGKRSGVQPCTVHMTRRYFAVKSLESGMSVYHLMRVGGWGSLTAMRPYIALSKADVRRAAQAHSVVENLFSR
jgi:integrase